jgi:hypothetical protein
MIAMATPNTPSILFFYRFTSDIEEPFSKTQLEKKTILK